MTASELAEALGGRREGREWRCPCPVHGGRSLTITEREGHILYVCRAGCEQAAVTVALRSLRLLSGTGGRDRVPVRLATPAPPSSTDRTASALRLWRSTRPAAGTLVETYLRTRGLDSPALPASLRYAPLLRHRDGGEWPAMVAFVQDGVTGAPMAVHRTYLARDGRGKAEIALRDDTGNIVLDDGGNPLLAPVKMMLGPVAGGAVRLTKAGAELLVGEGIETCLAALLATGRPTWAALSTSGLRALALPASVREVIVLADGDDAGETAAEHAAQRWQDEGRHVRIARPPRGYDILDVLTREA